MLEGKKERSQKRMGPGLIYLAPLELSATARRCIVLGMWVDEKESIRVTGGGKGGVERCWLVEMGV